VWGKDMNIKRRYFDMRQGNITVAPALQLTNFLMLSYLTINEIIPIWLFAPIFILGILTVFTLVGNKFRKHQTPTDINMSYEKSTEAGKTVEQMMDAELLIMNHLGIKPTAEFLKRLDYMKRIGEGKV